MLISGTAQSVGCRVDGMPPHDVIDKVNAGEYEIPDVSILSSLNFMYEDTESVNTYNLGKVRSLLKSIPTDRLVQTEQTINSANRADHIQTALKGC